MRKNIFLMLAAGIFALTSCSDDDNNNNQNDDDVVGTYRLAAVTAPGEQDLNEDGVASADLTTEYDCYSDWEIVLHANHTFTRTFNVVSAVDGELNCQMSQTASGTWERNGQTLVMTNTDGDGELTDTFTFSADDQILTQTGPGEFPTIFENIFIMEPGTLTTVYTRVGDE